jgi:hypothetical protein
MSQVRLQRLLAHPDRVRVARIAGRPVADRHLLLVVLAVMTVI